MLGILNGSATLFDGSADSSLSGGLETVRPRRVRLRSATTDRMTTVRRVAPMTTVINTPNIATTAVIRDLLLGEGAREADASMTYDAVAFKDLDFRPVNATVVASAASAALEALKDVSKSTNYLDSFSEGSRSSMNDVDRSSAFPLGIWLSFLVGTLLFTLFLFCVVGNLFVILTVVMERDLRSRPQYYLIFSLAIADLLVGMVVTPLGAWATLNQAWYLGVTLCDFWISVDVLVCTSSILHLVAIALDRYWSITDIYYMQNRTPKWIFFMLLLIWVVSLLISLAPIFGWKDAQFVVRVQEQHICLISQQISYQVFSTATAFYIPLCAIIVVYYKIMRAAKKRFRRERDRRTVNKARPAADDDSTVAMTSPTVGGRDGDAGGGDASFGGEKSVKKSAPLLSPYYNSRNCNGVPSCGATLTVEHSHFRPRYDSTTVGKTSASDEESQLTTGLSSGVSSPLSIDASNCRLGMFGENNKGNKFLNNKNAHNSIVQCNNGNHGDYDGASQFTSQSTFDCNTAMNNKNKNNRCSLQSATIVSAQVGAEEAKNISARSLFLKRQSSSGRAMSVTAALVKRKTIKRAGRTLKETSESRRERKAWRTLAIITGTFVACWTPFFLVSLYRPICHCHIPPVVESVTQWLGYLNSALNPVIYTVFSMDFRMAFQRILKRLCLMKKL